MKYYEVKSEAERSGELGDMGSDRHLGSYNPFHSSCT
jgi:hypothetical protein